MNRRNFLGTMLAACAAPAIVRADSLMRIVARETTLIPVEYGRVGHTMMYQMVSGKALEMLHRNIVFADSISKQFDIEFPGHKFSLGDIIQVRVPSKFALDNDIPTV